MKFKNCIIIIIIIITIGSKSFFFFNIILFKILLVAYKNLVPWLSYVKDIHVR